MAKEFALSVVAPDKAVVETTATSVVAPGLDGYFGIMAGHLPLVAALKPGLIEYLDGTGSRHYIYVGGGFAEVRDDRVTILADEAARAQDIDLAKAEADLEDARKTLRSGEGTISGEEAVAGLERAVNRIRAARTAQR